LAQARSLFSSFALICRLLAHHICILSAMSSTAVCVIVGLVLGLDAARIQQHQQSVGQGCPGVWKRRLCIEFEDTTYLLDNIGGYTQAELVCIPQYCEKEPEGQCCKLEKAVKETLQAKSSKELEKYEVLVKAMKVEIDLSSPVVSEPKPKPQWQIELEQRQAQGLVNEQRVVEAVEDSGSDEMCTCRMAGRATALAAEAMYKKSQLFTPTGKCTAATKCNECYHGTKSGIFECCIGSDCAPVIKKPKFNAEICICNGQRMLKSALYEEGQYQCQPDTACAICKDGCFER